MKPNGRRPREGRLNCANHRESLNVRVALMSILGPSRSAFALG